MEQHHVTPVLLDNCAVSRSGIAVIAAHDDSAAPLHQWDAFRIKIRTGHILRAPAHYLIRTSGTATAKVIGNKKIIVSLVTDDERRLDSPVARIEV
jgi:hypothetical protein